MKIPSSKIDIRHYRKWPWHCRDLSTWKYINFEVLKDAEGNSYIHWIINPHFAYKHLDK